MYSVSAVHAFMSALLLLVNLFSQEVRYDSSLHPLGKHAQISHLASLLPEYQYVYQPATVYFHADTYPSHDEEGCAVFSKHPIVHSDYLVRLCFGMQAT